MGTTKNEFLQAALALGFGDVRFADAAGTLAFSDTRTVTPKALLPSAACIAVMFMAYSPASAPPEGYMALSTYYAASHRSYGAAKQAAAFLTAHGAQALHTVELPARAAALRTGGHIGDNGFYYHPTLGSFVCIQTVLTDAFAPEHYTPGSNACLHCGACRRACPSGGVGHIENCVRRHLNDTVPEALRPNVYQLMGCEKCQSACPLNRTTRSQPHAFALDALLSGSETAALRALTGPNMARRRRILSQAALYAANTGQHRLLSQLKTLAQTEDEPVRTHARWACEKLRGEDDEDI